MLQKSSTLEQGWLIFHIQDKGIVMFECIEENTIA